MIGFEYYEKFSSLHFTLIHRKSTSFIILTMEGDTTISSQKPQTFYYILQYNNIFEQCMTI